MNGSSNSAKVVFNGKDTWGTFMSDTFTDYITTDVLTSMPATLAFANFISTIVTDFNVNEDGIGTFMQRIDTIAKESTGRTVYMDSNIALTDGRKHAKDTDVRIIPNLFDTIEGLRVGEEILAQKIDDIGTSHGPSTADGGLYIDVLRTNVSSTGDTAKEFAAYQQLQHVGDKHVVRLRPANLTSDTAGKFDLNAVNAEDGSSTFGFNIEADEISFTVTNRNAEISAYLLTRSDVTDDNFEMDIVAKVANKLSDAVSAYWIPLEDYEITSGQINKGDHGKIFINMGIDTNIVYASHAVAKNDIDVGEADDIKISEKMTYNLGAIIEAIQELNRRTMFMDIDMSFSGAMSYGDYVSDIVSASKYGKVLDGLPAATDSDTGKHYA